MRNTLLVLVNLSLLKRGKISKFAHEKYGRQFDATSVEKLKPDNMGAAKTYLMNLGIKGFGEKSVEKVLDYFGVRILEILREERPEEIKDVPGLRKLRMNYLIRYLVKVFYPI